MSLEAGDAVRGTWSCAIPLSKYAASGVWGALRLWIWDYAGNVREYTDAELQAGGYPIHFAVNNPGSDLTPPVLTGFSFSPDTVDLAAGAAAVEFTFTASDAAGMEWARAFLRPPGADTWFGCISKTPIKTTDQGLVFRCSVMVSEYGVEGEWRVESVDLMDVAGNSRDYSTAELQAEGFPTSVTVIRR